MHYEEARESQKQIRDANESERIGLIQAFRNVYKNLEQIAADLVSLKQNVNKDATNSNN